LVDYGHLEYLPVSRVSIILLNWNNWSDTLECLESLLRLDYPVVRILVCDNGSSDNSLAYIQAWADGHLNIIPSSPYFVRPEKQIEIPLQVTEYERSSAETGNISRDARLIVIKNGENLGFAGGNNVALKCVLACKDTDYVWLLNNDTVVEKDALSRLVDFAQKRTEVGICGSTVLNYWKPEQVDALGGAWYSRWLGLAWHIGRWRDLPKKIDPEQIAHRMDYVVGSSMFVSREFLHDVGMLDESYFLYFEELDWAMRCSGRFALGYAPKSIVYHKGGRSIGTATNPARKSMVCDYFTLRNRIKFTRQYYPCALPVIYLGLVVALAVRLVIGEWQRAVMIWRLMISPQLSFEECAR
jgi:GT2 family glycosyltransferase